MARMNNPRRWLGVWLSLFLGFPIALALLYVFAYQRLLDSPDYYPFWLGETFFYLALPAAALITWKVHWGKKHPFQYGILTLSLLVGIAYLAVYDGVEKHGAVQQQTIHPVGLTQDQLLTADSAYRIVYFPFDPERITEAIQQEEPMVVTLVERSGIILSFDDPELGSYPLWKRLLDLALGLLAAGVFVVFLWVVMSVWWKGFRVEEHGFVILRWGMKQWIPAKEVIHIRLDPGVEELQIDTEEVVYRFPYERESVYAVAQVAQRAGLTPINLGLRWVRAKQYEEINLTDETLVLLNHQKEVIPFGAVQAIRWDPVIQILLEDGTLFTITDERYMDRAWVEEMFDRVRSCWERQGRSYRWELDQEEESLGLSVMEEKEGLDPPA
ncbi:hypothetical protein [Desmospora activa]|uniref:Uncharacterized protein n=1 Tax=Desmospora activa DSM 45169 TaxID=1121389 RepID=A0A2T4Z3Q5_9BACL|nr:hypothetical protein [Desmospora activa]PTM56502.1 hypothetical protein C8J48_2824 [Desmospora activa DSM 45169]